MVPGVTGWPPSPPTAPGGSWGAPPPWGWSPYQAGAAAPQPPGATGTSGSPRKRAPWVVAVAAAVLVLAGLGVGVAIGYGVWNTSQAPAASVRPFAPFPNQFRLPPSTQSNRAFLGVEVTAGSTSGSGAHVDYVLPTSPAAKAGIVSGDTITAVGSTSVTSPASLRSAIDAHKPGQHVKISWTTSTGKKQTATVTLAAPSSEEG